MSLGTVLVFLNASSLLASASLPPKVASGELALTLMQLGARIREDGSAENGVKYKTTSGKLTFMPGEISKECPEPSEVFTSNGKDCPASGCLNSNTGYATFSTAWSQCGAVADCGFIMKYTDGKYYLRRSSDPDSDLTEAGVYYCISQECPEPSEVFTSNGKDCPASGCLNSNTGYDTFSTAWSQCGAVADCGFIMKYTDGKYYLRRSSDPDSDLTEAGVYYCISQAAGVCKNWCKKSNCNNGAKCGGCSFCGEAAGVCQNWCKSKHCAGSVAKCGGCSFCGEAAGVCQNWCKKKNCNNGAKCGGCSFCGEV